MREASHLTQQELGELLYASRRTVQDWEAGKRNMRALVWEYCCLLLQYPEVAQAREHWIAHHSREPSRDARHDDNSL